MPVSMKDIAQIRAEKRLLRRQYKTIRGAIKPAEKKESDSRITELFLESLCYQYGKKLLIYASFGSEADTWQIAEHALSLGKEVYYPRTYEGGKMQFFRITDLQELTDSRYGIKEPDEQGIQYEPSTDGTDICLVPGLCFDRGGYRIGYGKGFYDRFLTIFRGVSIGICYEACVSETELPREKRYDKPVDFLITDKEMIPIVS